MKLLRILLEQSGKPKAIIMAGGGGAGKSHILNQLGLSGIQIFNPDKYVEKQGINLSAASSMTAKEVQQATEQGESFIWDTTAGNPRSVQAIKDAGYDVAMIMVYTHPIVSFISNFDRQERSIPISAVLSTWKSTYSLIDTYGDMLGDNFYLISNTREDKFKKEIDNFNKAARSGSRGIQTFLDNIKKQDPEKYTSTFSQPYDIEDQEALQAYEQQVQDLDFDREDEGVVKNLKKHFMSFWNRGKQPPPGSMKTKVAAIDRDREKSKRDSKEVADAISKMITSPDFQQVVSSGDSIQDVKNKLQLFLNR